MEDVTNAIIINSRTLINTIELLGKSYLPGPALRMLGWVAIQFLTAVFLYKKHTTIYQKCNIAPDRYSLSKQKKENNIFLCYFSGGTTSSKKTPHHTPHSHKVHIIHKRRKRQRRKEK